MKLIVFSDSHGELRTMCEVIALEQPDYVLHLGDHDRDAAQLSRVFPMLPIVCVRGNCDRGTDMPLVAIPEYCGKRFFLCHGHMFGVKSGLLRAFYAARENHADILLYGHTHIPYAEEKEGLHILNPGACSGWRPTYGQIVLSEDGFSEICWKEFKREESK